MTTKYITTLDLARARGAKSHPDHGITAAEFDRLDIPFFAGCQTCAASLGPYNAYPSITGFIRCKEHIEGCGFDTIARYDTWEVDCADHERVKTIAALVQKDYDILDDGGDISLDELRQNRDRTNAEIANVVAHRIGQP
jgi:hypothetical protein